MDCTCRVDVVPGLVVVFVVTDSESNVFVEDMGKGLFDMAIGDYNNVIAARSLENKAAVERYTGAQAAASARQKGILTMVSAATSFGTSMLGSGTIPRTQSEIIGMDTSQFRNTNV